MAALVAFIGLIIGIASDSWIPFGIAIVIAFGIDFMKDAWLHSHMHKLYEGEEDDHGVKTID